MYTNLDDFLKDLPVHAARHADELRGHTLLVGLETDDGRKLYVRLNDGAVTVSESCSEAPACSVYASENVLLDMLNGRLSPMKAILLHKIKLRGDVSQLLALARLV